MFGKRKNDFPQKKFPEDFARAGLGSFDFNHESCFALGVFGGVGVPEDGKAAVGRGGQLAWIDHGDAARAFDGVFEALAIVGFHLDAEAAETFASHLISR